MKDRAEALGQVACDVLQRLVRELLSRKPGGHLVEDELRELDLRVALPSGDPVDRTRFAADLVAAVDRLLDDAVQQAAAFRPGHAYCHRCESSACEHGLPPSCRQVFVGYAPTGLPRWADFAQHCLDRRHPEVDRLYENPPALLTVVQNRAELHDGILDAFRSECHELMAQVVSGYFPVRSPAEEGRGVLALTVQAVATRRPGGRPRIGLNLLGRAPSGEALDSLWERLHELPWRRSVRWAQGALQSLVPCGGLRRAPRGRSIAGDAVLERRVQGIMRGLARRLERDQRARSRRTEHAERRHASGGRPTAKAVSDAREVGLDSFKVDARSGAMVVLGDRGRTHFFTPDGRLVSSVRYSRDAIERKIKTELWRQATETEMTFLRDNLAR